MADKIFAGGMRFEKPKEGTPDFVKGRLSFKVDEAVEFLQKYKNEKGWVNVDLLKSKEKGTLYLQLNDWKPKEQEDAKRENKGVDPIDYPEEDINPEDIPF